MCCRRCFMLTLKGWDVIGLLYGSSQPSELWLASLWLWFVVISVWSFEHVVTLLHCYRCVIFCLWGVVWVTGDGKNSGRISRCIDRSICVCLCLFNPTNSKLTCMTSCLTSVFVACFRIKYQHMLYATKHTVTPYPWTSAASAGWMLAVPQILYYLTLLIILHLNTLQF